MEYTASLCSMTNYKPKEYKRNHNNKEIGFKLADMAFQGLMQASLYGL